MKWLSCFVLAATLFFSCKQDPIGTGGEVIPPEDLIGFNVTDTVTIQYETVAFDTTDTYLAARQLFGNYIDPQFGRISATTYTQFLSRIGLNFGDTADLRFDSLVLNLVIDGVYGRSDQPQTVRVLELAESLPEERYVADATIGLQTKGENLALGQTILYPEGSSTALVYRIRLNDEFGKRLLFAPADSLEENDAFNEFFKGFAISTEPVIYYTREPGAVYSFFASSSSSFLNLYYREKDSTGTFVASEEPEPFLINSTTPRYTQIEKTEFEDKLIAFEFPDPDVANQFEFIQAGTSLRNFVKLPHIQDFDTVAVSQALLNLKLDPQYMGSNQRFNPPIELIAVLADETGGLQRDENGALVAVEPGNSSAIYGINDSSFSYNLVLTQYVQSLIMKREENYGFYLIPRNESFSLNRGVFGGTEHPTLKPSLRLVYSTLPK
ncbi:MAG: DUF4270 family protein [Bacteroidota bacterium]